MIIRHDVCDAEYRVDRSEFPALADLQGQGLAGIVSHKTAVIDFQNYHPGKYGSFSYQARISRYVSGSRARFGASIAA